jgi:DNA recombination protein RmuC
MGFKTFAIQKRSGEVWRVLGAVKTEFEKFEGILSSSQRRLLQVNDDLDRLIGVRTRSIRRSLKNVEQLDEGSAVQLLLAPEPDDEPAPEPENSP